MNVQTTLRAPFNGIKDGFKANPTVEDTKLAEIDNQMDQSELSAPVFRLVFAFLAFWALGISVGSVVCSWFGSMALAYATAVLLFASAASLLLLMLFLMVKAVQAFRDPQCFQAVKWLYPLFAMAFVGSVYGFRHEYQLFTVSCTVVAFITVMVGLYLCDRVLATRNAALRIQELTTTGKHNAPLQTQELTTTGTTQLAEIDNQQQHRNPGVPDPKVLTFSRILASLIALLVGVFFGGFVIFFREFHVRGYPFLGLISLTCLMGKASTVAQRLFHHHHRTGKWLLAVCSVSFIGTVYGSQREYGELAIVYLAVTVVSVATFDPNDPALLPIQALATVEATTVEATQTTGPEAPAPALKGTSDSDNTSATEEAQSTASSLGETKESFGFDQKLAVFYTLAASCLYKFLEVVFGWDPLVIDACYAVVLGILMVVLRRLLGDDIPPTSSDSAPLQDTTLELALVGVPLRDDPKYSKYFNLLKVGMPMEAVKHNMGQDGLDPSIMDQLHDIPVKVNE